MYCNIYQHEKFSNEKQYALTWKEIESFMFKRSHGSHHFLHLRRKPLTQDAVVLQSTWSNFQLLKNQVLMHTSMNLVLLIMKKKAAQSFPVCLEFFFFFFFFFSNFQRHSLIWGNDCYADWLFLGRGKGINSDVFLLLILDLHVFKINQFWNVEWWVFIMWLEVSEHSFNGLDHIRDCTRHCSKNWGYSGE